MKRIAIFACLLAAFAGPAMAQSITDAELRAALLMCGRHTIGKDPNTGNIMQEQGWENCQVLRDEEKARQVAKAAADQKDLETAKPVVDGLAKRISEQPK